MISIDPRVVVLVHPTNAVAIRHLKVVSGNVKLHVVTTRYPTIALLT